MELSCRIQELQNERNCMNGSKDFQDAESIRCGNSHVTSRPVSFPPHPTPEGMLSRSFGVPSRREGPPSIWDTLRCQSGPSAKNSVIFSGGDSSKNYGADQQRLQISDLHFDKFPTPATFACFKIRFKIEVCTCSQFPSEAMQWIKEVEMVDSVDDSKIFVINKRYFNAKF